MRTLLLTAAALLTAALVAPVAQAGAAPASLGATQTVVLTIHAAANGERVGGANFAVSPEVPVRVVIWNYTARLHSFASPELGINIAVLPGSATHPHKTVFTFRARTWGPISWYCAVPCGDDHMGGTVYAIIEI
jgi:hypothetical protein